MQRHLTEARSVKLESELGTLRALQRLFATSSVTVLRAHFRQQVAGLDVWLGRAEEGSHPGVRATERARAIAAAKRATHQELRPVLFERREQLLSLLENVSD